MGPQNCGPIYLGVALSGETALLSDPYFRLRLRQTPAKVSVESRVSPPEH